jgi:hypothetical protein
VDLHAVAQLAGVLVGGLEPALAQPAAGQPWAQGLHVGDDLAGVDVRRAERSSGRVVPRPSDRVVPSSITVPA